MQNTEFILVLLFIHYCIICHASGCSPTVARPGYAVLRKRSSTLVRGEGEGVCLVRSRFSRKGLSRLGETPARSLFILDIILPPHSFSCFILDCFILFYLAGKLPASPFKMSISEKNPQPVYPTLTLNVLPSNCGHICPDKMLGKMKEKNFFVVQFRSLMIFQLEISRGS